MSLILSIVIAIIAIFLIIIIVGIAGSFFANKKFNRKVEQEIKDLFNSNEKFKNEKIKKSDIQGLPDNVQRWLKKSDVLGTERINSVRLKQKASMRLERGKSWMPVNAEQYFTVGEPGFIWKARIKTGSFMHIVGRDKYYQGDGNMLIKFMSMITISDSSGPKMDQGTLLRYLAETVWFPTAVLEDYIEWKELDSRSAEATMIYGDTTASGTFEFNEDGEVVRFEADRYRELGGSYSKERWIIDIEEHGKMNGVKIPIKGRITWKLDSGDFTWFNFDITDIEYNTPRSYSK